MKWIVAGGRDFGNRQLENGQIDIEWREACYNRLHETCNRLTDFGDTIVSGGAKGADALGERYAKGHNDFLTLDVQKAEWHKHGKAAGHMRNHQMALQVDGLIAFWDGKSKGTKNMIENAHKSRLETHVYYY